VVEPGDAREPIGGRVIEVAEDLGRFVSRDSRSRFIAYVPPGSIREGQALVASGGDGRTVPCGNSTTSGTALRTVSAPRQRQCGQQHRHGAATCHGH